MVSTSDLELRFDPFSEEMMADPYAQYRRLRHEAPVYFNEIHGLSFWAVTRYDDVRRVLKDHEFFSNCDGIDLDGSSVEFFGPSDVVKLDPPDHTKIRRLLADAFKPGEIAKLEPAAEQVANRLIDSFIEAREADFARDYSWTLPIEMMSFMLGVPESDRPWVSERVLSAFRREPGVPDVPAKAIDAATDVRAYFGSHVPGRRADPQPDLLTTLSLSRNLNDELMSPDDEAGGLCLLLFAAGIITTGSFLANSLNVLSGEPGQKAKLILHPEIAPRAVEELWRLEHPVQNSCRTASKDVTLAGVEIKAGDRVASFLGSANRDELVWGDTSEQLDIDRPYKRSMIFGDGVHVCIGSHLARLEGRVGLNTLLARIPEYEISGPLERTDRATVRGLVSLPVRF